MRALAFISASNCERYIEKTLISIARQSFKNIRVLLINDASTDRTRLIALQTLNNLFQDRFTYVENNLNLGKAHNAYTYIRNEESDFVFIVDGDDYLIDSDIIEIFSKLYLNKLDVVWSNYITSNGYIGHCAKLDSNLHPRNQTWRTSHLFSFRLSLFKNIPCNYFKDQNNDWIMSACDQAIAYPILDQTRRYRYVDRLSYCYTIDNPNSHHNKNKRDGVILGFDSVTQRINAKIIQSKEPMTLINL